MSDIMDAEIEALNAEPASVAKFFLAPAVGRIVVEVLTLDERYDRGKDSKIILPSRTRAQLHEANRPTQGRIVAVANPEEEWTDESGKVWKPLYNVGDMVVFGRYSGVEIVGGKDSKNYIILNESDVLAVLLDDSTRVRVKS